MPITGSEPSLSTEIHYQINNNNKIFLSAIDIPCIAKKKQKNNKTSGMFSFDVTKPKTKEQWSCDRF